VAATVLVSGCGAGCRDAQCLVGPRSELLMVTAGKDGSCSLCRCLREISQHSLTPSTTVPSSRRNNHSLRTMLRAKLSCCEMGSCSSYLVSRTTPCTLAECTVSSIGALMLPGRVGTLSSFEGSAPELAPKFARSAGRVLQPTGPRVRPAAQFMELFTWCPRMEFERHRKPTIITPPAWPCSPATAC
jgi:hypothetical protein